MSIPVLHDEIAELLDDASPASDAATEAQVAAFLAEHQQDTRPNVLQGLTSALAKRFANGESRHQSTVPVLAGAMKEARLGLYPAQTAVDAIKPKFLAEVAKPPASRKQGTARHGDVATSEFDGILAWAVGQALGADLNEVQARVDEKMPDNVEWVNNIGRSSEQSGGSDQAETTAEDETVKTVPWPTLSDTAMHGVAGQIVNTVAPHTEADPAAVLVQLMAVFGATLGSGPHFIAGNERHQAIIHPLIVGRTNNGAKGTSLGVVEAIRKSAVLEFEGCTVSGLSTAEGLIELVRDPSGDPDDKDYDPGVEDKRLLVMESEYKSVLVRQRRDGNTVGQTMRDTWDCRTLRTLTRKHNKLTATRPHIVIIGHVTPGEFRATLEDSDLSGGSVNRLLICLSRRSRLNSRLGNLPAKVLADAATKFNTAYNAARNRNELKFTEGFWEAWDRAYRDLNRDRPDCRATDATARGVTQVLRLSLLYALFDGKPVIGVEHLNAALALWAYAEHSARWLFSNHELEQLRESTGGLTLFILSGGIDGVTRTEISRDYFKGNKPAAEISAELTPLVHDGVVIEVKDETGARPITRYIHRSLRINEFTNHAGQEADSATNSTNYVRTDTDTGTDGTGDNSYEFVNDSYDETPSDQENSFNSLFRNLDDKAGTNGAPPGGVTDATPGFTDRVQQVLKKVQADGGVHQ